MSLKPLECSRHRAVALFVVILFLSGVGYSADVVLVAPSNANSLERVNCKLHVEYYGVGLILVNAKATEQ